MDGIVNGKSNDEIWQALEENCRSPEQKDAGTAVFDYRVFGQ